MTLPLISYETCCSADKFGRSSPRMTALSIFFLAAFALGCKPPPASQSSAPNATVVNNDATSDTPNDESKATVGSSDGLPAKLVENVEQLIKLTAEYNARAAKITDRQAYLDHSVSLAELENELSNYVQHVEAAQATLTPAQKATLDSQYFSQAKPLIEAKRKHKERMLGLLQ